MKRSLNTARRVPRLLFILTLGACAARTTNGDAPDSMDAGAKVQSDAGARGCAVADAGASVASHQKITLAVRNLASEARYVTSMGLNCSPISLAGASGPIARQLNRGSVCEGEDAGPNRVPELTEIPPSITFELSIPAERIEVVDACDECRIWGGPPDHYKVARARPLPPGHYKVALAVSTSLPESCRDAGLVYECESAGITRGEPFEVSQLCELGATVEADFDLPPTGDVTVDVILR